MKYALISEEQIKEVLGALVEAKTRTRFSGATGIYYECCGGLAHSGHVTNCFAANAFDLLISLKPSEAVAQFWHGVYPDGWTSERVEAEMSDYHMVLDGLGSLIDYITGGRCSKPNTDKSVIKMLFDNHVNELIEERVKEELELVKPEQAEKQEPTAWVTDDVAITYTAEVAQRWRDKGWKVVPFYTAPPKREWVSLSEAQKSEIRCVVQEHTDIDAADYGKKIQEATEEVIKERNT